MSKNKKPDKKETPEKKMNRRQFLVGGSAALAAGAIAATTGVKSAAAQETEMPPYPESKGYLVYDSKKCIGCTTCMLSCSMVHYGEQNLSLARIQIMQDSFGKFPNDLQIAPCRQCCGTCLKMCPQRPHRTVWNHFIEKSSKCDLCIDTPYWNEKGGPGGKQACVESCPMLAIKFVTETPGISTGY